MTNVDVLLIAGLGPGHLENADLNGSFFDRNQSKYIDKKTYFFNNCNYSPDNLVFKNREGEIVPVLRPIQDTPPELIVTTLCSILEQAHFNFAFENISCIWENKSLMCKAKIVCLSTTFMWSERMIDVAINWVNQHIDYDYLIIGGQYGVLKKDYIFARYSNVDYLITGDAELSLVSLINAILNNGVDVRVLDIPNIWYKLGEDIRFTYESYGDINTYPTPKYEGNHDVIPYISMKGCVYNCKFCALSFCAKKWQYRSSDNIYKDWKIFKENNKAKHIDINDSTFFIPYKKVCDLLPKINELGLTWEANARADTPFTQDDVSALELSGCRALYFGFESMSDKVLGYINKKTTRSQNAAINELFKNSSIDTMMSFIVGFPGETIDDFDETRTYLLNDHYGHFNIYVFEFEDKSMPIWDDAERFSIEVFEDKSSGWEHGGENWRHIGMTSDEAKKLRFKLLHDIRINKSTNAIHKSWQYMYESDYIEGADRSILLQIEKWIDKLVFVDVDYDNVADRQRAIERSIYELQRYGIYPSERMIE